MVDEFSIGSLGSGNSEAYVSDVTVNRVKLYGTTNGVRIKTWKVKILYADICTTMDVLSFYYKLKACLSSNNWDNILY